MTANTRGRRCAVAVLLVPLAMGALVGCDKAASDDAASTSSTEAASSSTSSSSASLPRTSETCTSWTGLSTGSPTLDLGLKSVAIDTDTKPGELALSWSMDPNRIVAASDTFNFTATLTDDKGTKTVVRAAVTGGKPADVTVGEGASPRVPTPDATIALDAGTLDVTVPAATLAALAESDTFTWEADVRAGDYPVGRCTGQQTAQR